jgi:hypothetical protein
MAEIDYGAGRAGGAYIRPQAGGDEAMRVAPRLSYRPEGYQGPVPRHAGAHAHAVPPQPSRIQRIVNGAGALTSVALVVGLGVWGYRLAVRDVSGIPVIRALEGPARVAPDDPGGELARHQGLAVNTIAAEGEAAPAADTLTLAPKPAELAEGDLPMAELASLAVPQAAPEADPVLAALAPPGDGLLSTPLDLIAPDVPGVAVSLRPRNRPGGDVEADAAVAAVLAALAPEISVDVDPASLPSGTRLVQLGTFPTVEEAQAGWNKVAADFGPLFDGKRRVIEAAETNGEAFYRLRAEGFADVQDARRFCAVLEEQNATCVPAQVR